MTAEEKYCEDMRDMFLTAGWKHVVEELQEMVDDCESIHSVSTIEQLHHNKGMIVIAQSLLRLEDDIKSAEEEEGEMH